MKYIIKNLKTGQYLRQGDTYFVWTPDIYYARVFKGLKGANTVVQNMINKDIRWGGESGEYKIYGIEMKEIEV